MKCADSRGVGLRAFLAVILAVCWAVAAHAAPLRDGMEDEGARAAKAAELMREAIERLQAGDPRRAVKLYFEAERRVAFAEDLPQLETLLKEALSVLAVAELEPLDAARILVCQARFALGAPPEELVGEPLNLTGERPPGVRKPESLHFRPPGYTEEARKQRFEGDARFRVLIDREGCVTEVALLDELPYGMTELVVQAALGMVYRPAARNGEPVAAYMERSVRFQLQ